MEVVLLYLIKASGILALFLGVYHFFLKKETFFTANRHFLLGGVLGSFLLPFLEFKRYVEVEPAVLTEMAVSGTSATGDLAVQGPDWYAVLGWIYLSGVLWFGGKFLIQLCSLMMLVKGNRIRKIGGVRFVETEKDLAPFSFFNYIFYNPSQFSKAELNAIRQHEKAHCKQGHSLDMILASVLTIALWFNPLSWLYKRHIQQNLEFLADSSAVRQTKCLRNYQYTLLKVSSNAGYIPITNNFYNSLIKKRIVMLHKSRSSRLNTLKFMIVLPLLAGFLLAFNTKVVAQEKDVRVEVMINKIEILVDKDYTEEQMESDMQFMKEQGIDLKFRGVRRNSAGEITAIRASYEDKNGMSGNFSQKGDTPIEPFRFRVTNDGDDRSMGFFKGSSLHTAHAKTKSSSEMIFFDSKDDEDGTISWTTEKDGEKMKVIVEVKDGEKVITVDEKEISEEELKELGEKSGGKHIQVKKIKKGEGKNVFIIKDSMDEGDVEIIEKRGNSFFFIDSGKDDNPLFIVDGKETNREDFKDLSPSLIEKVEVIKGASATKEYGDRGRNGVIKITTKGN